MLRYDHERTEQIVTRLRTSERVLRYLVSFGCIGGLIALLVSSNPGLRWTGLDLYMLITFCGVVGHVIGIFVMMVFSSVLEWMCQMLIAHGELVERRAERDSSPRT